MHFHCRRRWRVHCRWKTSQSEDHIGFLGFILHAMIKPIRTGSATRSQYVEVVLTMRRVATLCSKPPPAHRRVTLLETNYAKWHGPLTAPAEEGNMTFRHQLNTEIPMLSIVSKYLSSYTSGSDPSEADVPRGESDNTLCGSMQHGGLRKPKQQGDPRCSGQLLL